MKKGPANRLGRIGTYIGLVGALGLGAVSCDGPITPTNKNPVAYATALPVQGDAPLPVTFDGTKSYDPDPTDSITKSIWKFGDGIIDSTSGAIATHTYATPGNYGYSLVVEDRNKGRDSTSLATIVVTQAPPVNHTPQISPFSAIPDSGYVPLNSRNKFSCTDPDGQQDIVQSYYYIGADTIRTTSLDSTFTFNTPGTFTRGAYCRDRSGAEAKAGPDTIKAMQAPTPAQQIAFYSTRETNGGHIYLGDITKTSAGKDTLVKIIGLTGSSERYADYESSWSPDGKSLVFGSNREGPLALFVTGSVNGSWTTPRRISPNIQLAMSPYWCSNNKIVFTFVNSGTTGVASVNPDGTNYQILYSEQGNTTTPWAYPTCSPDGNKIAFGADSSGNWEIYTMNLLGGQMERLTNNTSIDAAPIYLPNDSQMIFTSTRNGGWGNYVMNLKDKSVKPFFDGLDFKPSRDGKKFIFSTSNGAWCNNGGDALVSDNQIYIGSFDGTNLSNIEQLTFSGTSTSGLCSVSRWASFRPTIK